MKHPMRSLVLLAAPLLASPRAQVPARPWPVITRSGTQLLEGNEPFRFFGMAAPNLQINESQLRPDFSNRFPDEFEIRDTLDTVRRLGGRVTRSFALSIAHPDDKAPVYVSGRRVYNEQAFRCLDRVLALAREYDVRVIIPFVASQSYAGIRGVDEFAQLSGKPGASFWTDPEVKADFKDFLRFVLNRRNTTSGALYREDPAVLAWQLGNEFDFYAQDRRLDPESWNGAVVEWSREMAAFIKSVDPKHLIVDSGHLNWDGDGKVRAAMVEDPNVDLISAHLHEYWCRYVAKDCELDAIARQALADCKGKKPLVVDEFGLGTSANLQQLMRTIREQPGIAGGLLWGLRSHRRDGGWYYHNEDPTAVNSYHYPGFSQGAAFDETRQLELLRTEAFRIRGMEPSAPERPGPAPVLWRKGEGFTWRGSTGASGYALERAESPKGPWKILATGLEDSIVAEVKAFEHSPAASEPLMLFQDETAPTGKSRYYRIKGVNAAGETEYSKVLEVPAKP
jgi:mannan endo-1,4-beta-mannosidase